MPARHDARLRTCQGDGSNASGNSGERPWLRLVWSAPTDDGMEDWTSLGDAVLAMVDNAALAAGSGDSQRRKCASPGGGAAYPISRREGSD